MKSHAQAVVIGGGVVGCSVLYHLTKAGWKDVVLVERDELTCGSSWHAAGGFHTLNGDPNVAKLQQYTVQLYKEIEEISGQSCGLHLTGGVQLAGDETRLDWLKMAHARGRYLGMETEIVSAKEAKEKFPILDDTQFVGGLWDPIEGHLDPSGVTHAYAKAARIGGAEVYRKTKVEDLVPTPEGGWRVITNQGEILTDHVVNAGGLWAREVGRMVGLELPVLAMEHMYILTETIPEIVEYNKRTGEEIIHIIDFEGEIYCRQERDGMLLGTYEKACKPWSPKVTPWDFGHELLPEDLDRIAPSLEIGFRHFPALERTGIRQVINGPFTFAPDGNPLMGPVRGLPGFWCACAVMAGFSQGGGVGLALSNWMVDGDPGFDVWGMDVSRYGDWATLAYTNAKVQENYSRRFRIRFPNEELPAARPLKKTPLYDRLKARHAVFGDSWGLEHALWYAPSADDAHDVLSFRRSNDFAHVGNEVRTVRETVGLSEISTFAVYEATGAGVVDWLNHILPGRLPKVGRMALSPMLNDNGMLIGDFTLARTAEDRFFIAGSGVAQEYHMRWFAGHLPRNGASITPRGLDLPGLALAGPNARAVLQGLTDRDLSTEAFPFMSYGRFDIGPIPAWVGRISFTGEMGYEIRVRPEYLQSLFDLLMEAGAAHGIGLFGGRALNSLRLEKGWGSWAREYRPIYTAFDAGLDGFISGKRTDYIGYDAVQRQRASKPQYHLTTLIVDAVDADVVADEPIWQGEDVVGWVTSGGYAHWPQKSVAMGYIRSEAYDPEADYGIEIIGDVRPARVQREPLLDPDGSRMRA